MLLPRFPHKGHVVLILMQGQNVQIVMQSAFTVHHWQIKSFFVRLQLQFLLPNRLDCLIRRRIDDWIAVFALGLLLLHILVLHVSQHPALAQAVCTPCSILDPFFRKLGSTTCFLLWTLLLSLFLQVCWVLLVCIFCLDMELHCSATS